MRRPELDYILSIMLDAYPEVSDLIFTVDRPLQVETAGELKPVPLEVAVDRLTPFQTEMIATQSNWGESVALRGITPAWFL